MVEGLVDYAIKETSDGQENNLKNANKLYFKDESSIFSIFLKLPSEMSIYCHCCKHSTVCFFQKHLIVCILCGQFNTRLHCDELSEKTKLDL